MGGYPSLGVYFSRSMLPEENQRFHIMKHEIVWSPGIENGKEEWRVKI